jgi:hypothetical protein
MAALGEDGDVVRANLGYRVAGLQDSRQAADGRRYAARNEDSRDVRKTSRA